MSAQPVSRTVILPSKLEGLSTKAVRVQDSGSERTDVEHAFDIRTRGDKVRAMKEEYESKISPTAVSHQAQCRCSPTVKQSAWGQTPTPSPHSRMDLLEKKFDEMWNSTAMSMNSLRSETENYYRQTAAAFENLFTWSNNLMIMLHQIKELTNVSVPKPSDESQKSDQGERLSSIDRKLSAIAQGLKAQSEANSKVLLEIQGLYKYHNKASPSLSDGGNHAADNSGLSPPSAQRPTQPKGASIQDDSSEKQSSWSGAFADRIKNLIHSESSSQSKQQLQEVLDQVAKLKQENDVLSADLRSAKASCEAKERDLQRLMKERDSHKEKMAEYTRAIMAFKSQTEGHWIDSPPPASVAQKFEKLFSADRRNCGDETLQSSSGKVLANEIFKTTYEECQRTVLIELFRELFSHHEPGADTTTADDQVKIYGQLLCLKKRPLQEIVDLQSLTEQVLKKLSTSITRGGGAYTGMFTKHSPVARFVQSAVETALDMVAMQPPMVFDCPRMLISEDMQEIQGGEWPYEKLHEDEYHLEYYRPILYTNYKTKEANRCARLKVAYSHTTE